MTICFKSSWQFCIMIEKYPSDGLSYSEYNFDQDAFGFRATMSPTKTRVILTIYALYLVMM